MNFTAILYTNNQCPKPVFDVCFNQLVDGVLEAGGELVTVAWKQLEDPRSVNIQWDEHVNNHENLYRQIQRGLDCAAAPVVALCEHDVWYPKSYFEKMVELAYQRQGSLCYNTHVWHCDQRGYYPVHPAHLFMSNLVADTDAVEIGIEEKLTEINKTGKVVWAEPGYGKPVIRARMMQPTIDVRHGSNFTGGRASLQNHYQDRVPNLEDSPILFSALFPKQPQFNDEFRNVTEVDIAEERSKDADLPDYTLQKRAAFTRFKKLNPQFAHIEWSDFDQNVFYGHIKNADGTPKSMRCQSQAKI